MIVWGSRFPFSLDPLMKEAKRRMRRRRVLSAAVILLLAGGAVGAALALGGSPQRPAIGPAQARMSPLSNLAARMAFCGNTRGGCQSPDGKWSIVYVNRSPGPVSYNYSNGKVSGYNPPPVGCTLTVRNLANGGREQIHLRVPACDHGLWLGHTYIFQDPVSGAPSRVLSVDLPSRHVKTLAHFGSDVVSPDGRWVAGEAELPPYRCGSSTACHTGPWLVAVVSVANHTCRVVTERRGLDPTSGSQDVAVDRSPWEIPTGLKLSKDPVVWHDVVQGGTKVQVVTGPGTGFTRDSRSVIVGTWQFRTHPITKMGPIDKRLVKVDLSSLHAPCPASVSR